MSSSVPFVVSVVSVVSTVVVDVVVVESGEVSHSNVVVVVEVMTLSVVVV